VEDHNSPYFTREEEEEEKEEEKKKHLTLEALMSRGLHTCDVVMFTFIVQELLNIEQFCH